MGVTDSADSNSGRFRAQLASVDPGSRALIQSVPLQNSPPLSPDWLRCEMLERFQILEHTSVVPRAKVLEVGAGAHAIATVPLAFRVGAHGRLVAVERERWTHFREVVELTGMEGRVRPVRCDARELPFRSSSFDMAACLHGIRSLGSPTGMVEVLREMLRVAPKIILAESLPVVRSDAQRAHMAMYALREDVFLALTGRKDDLHYLPLESLGRLVEEAGGSVTEQNVMEPNLPHALAYLPRGIVEGIPDEGARVDLLKRWDDAYALMERYGADHPPVGIVAAQR